MILCNSRPVNCQYISIPSHRWVASLLNSNPCWCLLMVKSHDDPIKPPLNYHKITLKFPSIRQIGDFYMGADTPQVWSGVPRRCSLATREKTARVAWPSIGLVSGELMFCWCFLIRSEVVYVFFWCLFILWVLFQHISGIFPLLTESNEVCI